MDTAQFNQILQVFQNSQQPLINKIAELQVNPSTVPVSTNNILPFDKFDHTQEKFKDYLGRFEMYLSI